MRAVSSESTVPPQICCGRRRRSIRINGGTALEFTYCSACETIRWFSNGHPVDRTSATALAGRIAAEAKGARPGSSGPRQAVRPQAQSRSR